MATNISEEISRIINARDDSFDAVEEKGVLVPVGSTIDDLADLIRAIPTGSGSAITIEDTVDEHGGTIRTITAVSLAGDTVSSSVLAQGYTAHNSLGQQITGSATFGDITVEQLNVTENATYTAPTGKAYSPVVVNVPGSAINNQNKSVSPTESQQEVTYDSGYTGLGTVTVGAISSTYVGSEITRRDSTSLSASGATVTAPSGYYASQATKTISSGSVTAPNSISGTSASVSTGTNTLTLSKTISVTPSVTTAGYISSGTAGNSSVSLTASVTTQAAKTVTPTKSSQTAVSSGTYCTGTITVGAIPSNYIDTTDANATASQINSGATAYVNGTKITGEQVIQTYYTGSSTPSSTLGINGDLYLKVS